MKIENRHIVAESGTVQINMGDVNSAYVELYMNYYSDPSPSNPVGRSIELIVWRRRSEEEDKRIEIDYKKGLRYTFIKEDKLWK